MTDIKNITGDGKLRLIGGLTAAISLLFGMVLVLLLPLATQIKINIFYVIAVTVVFTAIYNLIPALNKNNCIGLLPGLFYSAIIAFTVFLSGEYGYLFMLFYLLLLSVGAFVYRFTEYFVLVAVSVAGVLVATLYPDLIIEAEYLVGLYMMLTLSILLRIFANNIFSLRAENTKFTQEISDLENDKGEIRNLLESLSDGLIVVDAENKITFINPSALKIIGIITTPEKIIGRDVNDFLPTIGQHGPEPITREAFGCLEHSIRNDFRVVTAEKTVRLHTNISPVIGEHAKLKGAVILFRDITDSKRTEEQQAEFNAIASHELRTPLSVIEGYLFYVLDPSSKLKYDKETAEYINRAHEAAAELNGLVTDILTVVKAEEGELEVNLKKIEPVSFFEKITDSFEGRATAKKLKIHFESVSHEKIPDIVTDPVKLKEILNNLISNAIKFTQKGSVKVEVGLLKNELMVKVIDTGAGISENDQEGIFNKFYRAENWQTRKTKGTGLGLYIAKTLTERLGGRMGVRSTLGRGSTFFFTLPLEYQLKKPEEIN